MHNVVQFDMTLLTWYILHILNIGNGYCLCVFRDACYDSTIASEYWIHNSHWTLSQDSSRNLQNPAAIQAEGRVSLRWSKRQLRGPSFPRSCWSGTSQNEGHWSTWRTFRTLGFLGFIMYNAHAYIHIYVWLIYGFMVSSVSWRSLLWGGVEKTRSCDAVESGKDPGPRASEKVIVEACSFFGSES